jgi:hypothetical protein
LWISSSAGFFGFSEAQLQPPPFQSRRVLTSISTRNSMTISSSRSGHLLRCRRNGRRKNCDRDPGEADRRVQPRRPRGRGLSRHVRSQPRRFALYSRLKSRFRRNICPLRGRHTPTHSVCVPGKLLPNFLPSFIVSAAKCSKIKPVSHGINGHSLQDDAESKSRG